MYSYEGRIRAVELYIKLGERVRPTIRQLGYPTKGSLKGWYNEYQQKNLTMAKERIKLYEQTAYAYGNMTPAVADSLAKKYFDNRMSQEKSLEEYYKKIKAATNATLAFEFYQAEVYLLTQIRASIMQQIPTYGQVQIAAKKKN